MDIPEIRGKMLQVKWWVTNQMDWHRTVKIVVICLRAEKENVYMLFTCLLDKLGLGLSPTSFSFFDINKLWDHCLSKNICKSAHYPTLTSYCMVSSPPKPWGDFYFCIHFDGGLKFLRPLRGEKREWGDWGNFQLEGGDLEIFFPTSRNN